ARGEVLPRIRTTQPLHDLTGCKVAAGDFLLRSLTSGRAAAEAGVTLRHAQQHPTRSRGNSNRARLTERSRSDREPGCRSAGVRANQTSLSLSCRSALNA